MMRREFVTVVGCTVLLGPVASFAQQPSKQATIGYLGGANGSKAIGSPRLYVALANLAGSKAAPSPSKFAGREVVQSALPRLQLSSCGKS